MTKSEKEENNRIVALGCIVCRRMGIYTPAQIHHVRKLATSKKRNNAPKVPLCFQHHLSGLYGTALHAGEKRFEQNFGSVLEMVEETKQLLERGEKN
jgi:hypothetical protein